MKRVFVLLLMFSIISVNAQELTFWQKLNNRLTVIKNIDSVYIYHPKLSFTLGVFSRLQQAGLDVNVKYKLLWKGHTIPGVSTYHIQENLNTKLGMEVGYGKLVLGYGFEVGPKKAYKKRAFAMNILGQSWGIHFSYFRIDNPFLSEIELKDHEFYIHDAIYSREPATLKNLAIDAYYVFNHKRFAYPATYKAGLVQRRTAGSWMLTLRYAQGSLHNSPWASFNSYNLLNAFGTMQISLGGGYSANIVCWHKNPTKPHDKGLRNFTINLTALPVLTVFDYLRTKYYLFDKEGFLHGYRESKIFCCPMPNVIGSAALGMTLDRFFISAQFTYHWFYFLSISAYDSQKLQIPHDLENVRFRGSFHDWTLNFLFTYKF